MTDTAVRVEDPSEGYGLARKVGRLLPFGLLSGFACLVLALTLYNQPNYPVMWLDEGFTLQGALNLTRHGQYAMRSSEGFRVLDQPLIANGPGVVLPITLAFELFGEGFLQARFVVALYAAATAVLFFLVAWRLFGSAAALLAFLFLVGYPMEGFIFYGRQALGLVPSLGYFLAGCLVWLTALDRRGWLAFGLSGILFGLASITKGQYLLVLPVLFLVALIDRFFWRQIGLGAVACAVLGMLFVQATWYIVQLMLVGWGSFGQHLAKVAASAAVTVLGFRPKRIPGSLWYLIRTGSLFLDLPAVAYVGWSFRKDSYRSSRHLLLLVFVSVWFCWYAFVSVGWYRYALDAIVVGSIFVGKLAADLGAYAVRAIRHRGLGAYRSLTATLAVALLILIPCYGLVRQITQIGARHEPAALGFATYLQEHIPPGAVIESWEWELDALTHLTYHHPTNDVVDGAIARSQFGGDNANSAYWPADYHPSFLIDGAYSKWIGLYEAYLASNCCTRVASFGLYDLYAITQK